MIVYLLFVAAAAKPMMLTPDISPVPVCRDGAVCQAPRPGQCNQGNFAVMCPVLCGRPDLCGIAKYPYMAPRPLNIATPLAYAAPSAGSLPSWCMDIPAAYRDNTPACRGGGSSSGDNGDIPSWCLTIPEGARDYTPACRAGGGGGSGPTPAGGVPAWCKDVPEAGRIYIEACKKQNLIATPGLVYAAPIPAPAPDASGAPGWCLEVPAPTRATLPDCKAASSENASWCMYLPAVAQSYAGCTQDQPSSGSDSGSSTDGKPSWCGYMDDYARQWVPLCN